MERKHKLNTIILALFFLSLIINAVNAQKTTYTVDPNGKGDYKTIQEAINNAPEGSTITIKKGIYSEIIEIRKKLTLIGEDKDYTIINPISQENRYAVRIGAPETIIKSLSISNGAPGLYTNAIRITTNDVTIENCNIHNTPVGIAIWTSDNTIKDCLFWNCKDEGIALLGSPYSQCENNIITNCIFHNNCDGVELQYSSFNKITNCEFYENTHTGIDAISSSNNQNIISNCKIYNNRVHGIYLSGSSDNQIIECTIIDNKDGNIIMYKNSENNIITSTTYEEPEINEQNSNSKTIQKTENNDELTISKILETVSNLNIFRIIPLFSSYIF